MHMRNNDEPYIYEDDFGLSWGNKTFALRWNHILSNKLFSNTTLTYSQYKFSTGMRMMEEKDNVINSEMDFEYISGIDDIAGKIDFDYIPNPNHNIKFGISNIYHTFKPGVNAFYIQLDEETIPIDTTFGNRNIYATTPSGRACKKNCGNL